MGKVIPFAFGGMKLVQKAGYEQPPAEDYRMVHEGVLSCYKEEDTHKRLLRLIQLYGDCLPEGYRGRNVAPSDVLELYDDTTRKFYYRDKKAFWPVQFSAKLARKL